ncbi:hypothetical protein SRHO_G00007680 [Serrasalmus rhombeus]
MTLKPEQVKSGKQHQFSLLYLDKDPHGPSQSREHPFCISGHWRKNTTGADCARHRRSPLLTSSVKNGKKKEREWFTAVRLDLLII